MLLVDTGLQLDHRVGAFGRTAAVLRLESRSHSLQREGLVTDLSSVRVYAAAQRYTRDIEAVGVLLA